MKLWPAFVCCIVYSDQLFTTAAPMNQMMTRRHTENRLNISKEARKCINDNDTINFTLQLLENEFKGNSYYMCIFVSFI